jgi:hypothetical protein
MFQIRESQNHLANTDLSLFHPGGCPSYCDHCSAALVVALNLRTPFKADILRDRG